VTGTRLRAAARGSPIPSFTPVRGPLLQRKCACGGTPGRTGECEACRKKKLQRRIGNGSGPSALIHPPSSVSEVPPIVREVLRSPGQPLDAKTRGFMEPRFGHDFGQVRVHADAKAAESAQSVEALAYTVGQDVVFGHGAYQPGTAPGKSLLAHELIHTIQQETTQLSSTENLTLGQVGTAEEMEAERGARRLSEGGLIPPSEHRAKGVVQRVGFGDLKAHEAELERIQEGCPVKSEGTLSEVSWGETSGLYPSKENIYAPEKWDAPKKCELLRLRGAIHAVGQRGNKVHTGTPGKDPFEQKLKPFHLVENFLLLDPEIANEEVKWFYLSNQADLPTHPTMSSLVWVKKYGPFHNVGGGDVPKGDVYVHFYKQGLGKKAP
jgi:hypothetical protein